MNSVNTECIPVGTEGSPYSYTTTGETVGTQGTAGLLQPDECFKIDAKPDWLSGYSVEFTPKNDGVTWGEIDWFGDLEYESKTFAASDFSADICDDAVPGRSGPEPWRHKWTRMNFDAETYRCDRSCRRCWQQRWQQLHHGLEARPGRLTIRMPRRR